MTRSEHSPARHPAGDEGIGTFRARVICRAEVDAAALYAALAELERRPERALGYRRISEAEGEHARHWALRLYEAGGRMPARIPSWRARLLARLARRYGPDAVLPLVRRLQHWHHSGLAFGRP